MPEHLPHWPLTRACADERHDDCPPEEPCACDCHDEEEEDDDA